MAVIVSKPRQGNTIISDIIFLICNNTFGQMLILSMYSSLFKIAFERYTANAYRQTTDKLMFKSVISTVR